MNKIAHRQNYPTADRSKRQLARPNLMFIVLAPIVLIVLIIASIVAGVGVDPDLSTFLSP